MRSTITYFSFCMGFLLLWACKKWDNHIAPTEQALDQTLTQAIAANPKLVKFSESLVKTGLDKVLDGAGTFTVWAPENAAMDALPADVKADTAKLKRYLLNHIAGLQYFTSQVAAAEIRVPMLNGKRISFFAGKLDEATVTEADRYVKNGVLQVVNKALEPLQSIGEYIKSTTATYQQNSFVASLVYQLQDPNLAELDSINPLTGAPVYKPGTGMVTVNAYSNLVHDLNKEDSLFTYVVLANTTYVSEKTKQAPYFKSVRTGIADTNTAWNVVKDLSFKGAYTKEQLPASLVSRFNVHVSIDKAHVIASYKMSNGIVHVVDAVSAPMNEKIPTITVDGAAPVSYLHNAFEKVIFIRSQRNPVTGLTFRDIYANLGSSGAGFQINYLTNDLYTAKYKVYYMALNNKITSGQGDAAYGTDSALQQHFIMRNLLSVNGSQYTVNHVDTLKTKVPQNFYGETYLGEFTIEEHNAIIPAETGLAQSFLPGVTVVQLTAPPSGTLTGIPYNLTLGYLKFVPVVQ